MDLTVLLIFTAVYLGMLLGEIPGLALDRTGVALLGAIALLVAERVSPTAAWQAVDVSTMALLFGLMVVSAQFRLGGFYARVTERITGAALAPPGLLAALIGTAGVLSAVLANDIVCLAMAPIVVAACSGRRLDARPFLLALAAAANVGSAATLIGNPQNMLIGQVLNLSFADYLLDAALPALLGLGVVWAVIVWRYRGAWVATGGDVRGVAPAPFDAWQTGKGLAVLAVLMALFLFTAWPRDVVALAAAGVLLLSRRMASRDMLALVDWQLLLLFMALFVVNHALAASGTLTALEAQVAALGIDLRQPGWLFGITVVLSNLVSNVPAVMLLLPMAQTPLGGPILALASTLAGNLILVGSIANLIVIDQAARLGVRIGWAEHARVGVPITLITLALAAGWLWLRA
jgi:Na+/H+ antiporter NhaD/arsenite permease-like protein